MEHVVINSLFVVALGIIGMHTHMFANKNREKERKKAPNSCTLAAARTYIGIFIGRNLSTPHHPTPPGGHEAG